MFKKVLGIGLAASLLAGTPAFAAQNFSNEVKQNSIIDIIEDAEMVTIIGTLELQPIYYLVQPGPNEPLFRLKVVTDSGKQYFLNAPVESFEMYEGKTVYITGFMKNSLIFNFYFNVL